MIEMIKETQIVKSNIMLIEHFNSGNKMYRFGIASFLERNVT